MTITILVVIAIIAGLVVALYFQIKAAHKQSDDQQQLLAGSTVGLGDPGNANLAESPEFYFDDED